VNTNWVAPDFFTVYGLEPLAGRAFTAADALEGSAAVIVDQSFADQLLGAGTCERPTFRACGAWRTTRPGMIGRRVRYVRTTGDPAAPVVERGPWHEIVGIVPDFESGGDASAPGVFHATTLDRLSAPVRLAIRVRATPASTYAGRLREITAAVDPALQLGGLVSVADARRKGLREVSLMALALIIVTVAIIVLSAAGIYAMMSFTVVRRRREIGIRLALGADPRRILASIFARAGAQLAIGVVVGLILAFVVGPQLGGGGTIHWRGMVLLPLVAALMVCVGLLAALGPARRGLAIQPTEALHEE
jgi:hypothetical protein